MGKLPDKCIELNHMKQNGKLIANSAAAAAAAASENTEPYRLRPVCHRKRWRKYLKSQRFHKFLLLLIIIEWILVSCEMTIDYYLNGAILFVSSDNRTDHQHHTQNQSVEWHMIKEWLQIGSLILQTIFVIEILTKIFLFGKQFFKSSHDIFDLIIIGISWILSMIFMHHKYLHYTSAIIVLRIWNILRIVYGMIEAEHESEIIENNEENNEDYDEECEIKGFKDKNGSKFKEKSDKNGHENDDEQQRPLGLEIT